MSLSAIASLLAVHIIGMASPGPDIFLVLRLAVKSRKHALAAVAGISLGAAMWISLTVFGFAAVLATHPWVLRLIELIGGLFLAYMGFGMLRAGIGTLRQLRAGVAPAVASAPLQSPARTFRYGLFTNLSNPKVVLFLAAVLSQFIPADASLGVLFLCAVLLIGSQLAFFFTLALVVSTDAVVKRMLLLGPWIDVVAGVVFLGMSVALVLSGAQILT